MQTHWLVVPLCLSLVTGSFAAGQNSPAGVRKVWLSDLDLSKTRQGWGTPHRDQSVDGRPLRLGGRTFARGLGTHADSILPVDLGGGSRRFQAVVGVDAETGGLGTVEFRILADGKQIYQSGILQGSGKPREVDVDVTGVRLLSLIVTTGNDTNQFDHADWAEAVFEVTGPEPKAMDSLPDDTPILTPKPAPEPALHGARAFGVRPGSPVLYTIAATGQRPMRFSAEKLPAGLSIDPVTGRMTGEVDEPGEYTITLQASNELGRASQNLRLMVGETIALTPPMGWNSWNCWGRTVSDQKIRAAAAAMVKTGLIQHGWQYVIIDDCWMVEQNSAHPIVGGPTRDEAGRILPNGRFPDMKALVDHVHSLGLKAGIYASMGLRTHQSYEGSWGYEQLDARQFAAWGFDYLKYCYTAYPEPPGGKPTLRQMQEPILLMRLCLNRLERDLVLSLGPSEAPDFCAWAATAGANCWRTTPDIDDTWGRVTTIASAQSALASYAGPGHWNDPDMLVVGKLGGGPDLHHSRLTGHEQYAQVSLWCLLAAPLLLGCDLTQLDEFTLGLLTNDEVLEVNQDPLGLQARCVARDAHGEVWAKRMEDRSVAVGLFNRDEIGRTISAKWSDLGLRGPARVRDLWRQQDLGTYQDTFEAEVPRHGVVLVRLFPAGGGPQGAAGKRGDGSAVPE